jgi:glycosyltransferase involved in cell wall biosynthesis
MGNARRLPRFAAAAGSSWSTDGLHRPFDSNVARRMRIALVLTGLFAGGAQRRMLTLAAEFLARGHAVDVVVPHGDGAFRDRVPAAAKLVALDPLLANIPGVARRKSLLQLASVVSLARYLRREIPDVVLSSSTPANLAALVARDLAAGGARDLATGFARDLATGVARDLATRVAPDLAWAGIPVVACVNVPISSSTTTRGRPLQGRLVRRYYPRAAAVITIAEALAKDTADSTGVARERIVTVPFPIDAGRIRELAASTFDHPWFAAGEPPVVLGVGKLKAQKDFATLVRAFAVVRASRPARLLILGDGEEREALLSLAQDLGIAADVSLPGYCDNPFPAMTRAAVLALSSRWEGFSNVASEALACGCPVVATRCPGGVAELLGEGRFGRLVAVGDSTALASALVETLDCPPPRGELAARADEFPVGRAAERTLEVLEDCVARRRSPAGAAREGGSSR